MKKKVEMMKSTLKWLLRRNNKTCSHSKNVEGETDCPRSTEEPKSVEEKMEAKDGTQSLRNKGKLFVGGLSFSTTEKSLEAYFMQFGEVIDCIVIRYPHTKKSRGFGFVTFTDHTRANSVLKSDRHILDGRNIEVRPFCDAPHSAGDPKKEKTFKVFLGGLSDHVTVESLTKFFERFGEVSEVKIPLDKETKKPKGFGFVYFKNEEAAKKCLSQNFVYFSGRRVHLRKSIPRERSVLPEIDSSSEVDCGASSSTSQFKIEENIGQKLLEDFFSAKSKSLSKMDEVNSQKVNDNVAELEQLLTQVLVSCSGENNNSDQALIKFSSDSESENSNCSSGDILYDTFCNENDDGDADEKEDERDECSADEDSFSSSLESVRSQLEILLTGSEESFRSKDFSLEENKGSNTPVEFKFKDSRGSLFCSLCEWCPSDGSSESFLSHCKSAAHRTKLKERFSKELPEDTMKVKESPQTPEQRNKLVQDPNSNLGAVSRKSSHEGGSDNQNKDLIKKVKQYPNKKKNSRTNKIKNKNVGVQNPSNWKTAKTTESCRANKIKNLKALALAKGMSSIRLQSNDMLKCTMCNKKIPKASEFMVLMKNVSQHLQSRVHLKKLLHTENCLKESRKEQIEKTKATTNSSHQPRKTQEQEKAPPKNKTEKKPKTFSSQVLFTCLPCNYLNGDIKIFKDHLKSTSHASCCDSKNVQPKVSLDNLNKCAICQNFLFGSTDYVNKHYKNCLKKRLEC